MRLLSAAAAGSSCRLLLLVQAAGCRRIGLLQVDLCGNQRRGRKTHKAFVRKLPGAVDTGKDCAHLFQIVCGMRKV